MPKVFILLLITAFCFPKGSGVQLNCYSAPSVIGSCSDGDLCYFSINASGGSEPSKFEAQGCRKLIPSDSPQPNGSGCLGMDFGAQRAVCSCNSNFCNGDFNFVYTLGKAKNGLASIFNPSTTANLRICYKNGDGAKISSKCNGADFKGCYYMRKGSNEFMGCLTEEPMVFGKTVKAGTCERTTEGNVEKSFCYCTADNCNRDEASAMRNPAPIHGCFSFILLSLLAKMIH